MTAAVIFAVIAALFLFLFIYAADLVIFVYREEKRFRKESADEKYGALLNTKMRKTKHPQKKNYYLYLICLTHCALGEREKALRLAPFLKKDRLLGVDEKSI